MSQFTLETAVGQWVADNPGTARVFESLGIDYCCGGRKPLVDACQERRLDPNDVSKRLQEAGSSDADEAPRWQERSLAELCNHIEATHHAFLREELPRLTAIIAKVVNAHGERHPELSRLQQVFLELRSELEPHMFKEERILFPAIRALEHGEGTRPFPFGSVLNPIHMMEHEHDQAGGCLARIRELTDDFRVPDGACNTYRVMLASLADLEADMHEHIHKENNVLFPRAAELEALVVA